MATHQLYSVVPEHNPFLASSSLTYELGTSNTPVVTEMNLTVLKDVLTLSLCDHWMQLATCGLAGPYYINVYESLYYFDLTGCFQFWNCYGELSQQLTQTLELIKADQSQKDTSGAVEIDESTNILTIFGPGFSSEIDSTVTLQVIATVEKSGVTFMITKQVSLVIKYKGNFMLVHTGNGCAGNPVSALYISPSAGTVDIPVLNCITTSPIFEIFSRFTFYWIIDNTNNRIFSSAVSVDGTYNLQLESSGMTSLTFPLTLNIVHTLTANEVNAQFHGTVTLNNQECPVDISDIGPIEMSITGELKDVQLQVALTDYTFYLDVGTTYDWVTVASLVVTLNPSVSTTITLGTYFIPVTFSQDNCEDTIGVTLEVLITSGDNYIS